MLGNKNRLVVRRGPLGGVPVLEYGKDVAAEKCVSGEGNESRCSVDDEDFLRTLVNRIDSGYWGMKGIRPRQEGIRRQQCHWRLSLSIFLGGGEQQGDDASDAVNHVVAHKVDRRERIRSVEVVEVWGYSGWAFRLRAAPMLALSAMISIGDDDEVNGGRQLVRWRDRRITRTLQPVCRCYGWWTDATKISAREVSAVESTVRVWRWSGTEYKGGVPTRRQNPSLFAETERFELSNG